ncbi:SCAN domain-containing protein 3-like [Palaemon carinicauda]|uniref:SCAN domain-containing protein 3-like n=1 Tax=Palaemon carinicauda TaxID=392227 RepID=UPI0035B5E2C2
MRYRYGLISEERQYDESYIQYGFTAINKQKEKGLKRARFDRSRHFRQQNEAGLRASYMVSLRIAQEKKPHNIAEKLIVPCCKDIIRLVLLVVMLSRRSHQYLSQMILFIDE